MRNHIVLCALAVVFCLATVVPAEVFQEGGDRLVATQKRDGGWDWPLSRDPVVLGLLPLSSNAPNILAPTGMGLLYAYLSTGDPGQLEALTNAAGNLLSKTPQLITPSDGYFAAALDVVFEVTTHTDYVNEKFYEPLAAGAYDFLGDGTLLVDTPKYIAIMRWLRDRQGAPNLAALDCGVGLFAASLIGADTAPWIAATKAEVDELDGGDVYSVLGLAGAVFGLASVGEDIDPTEGEYAAADSLADLAAVLAGYQLSTGGFTWNSLNMEEDAANETVQETAFAILALNEVDRQAYLVNIENAAAYLEGVRLPTGGWENFLGEGENNEVTGESLWALWMAQQAQVDEP